MGPIVPAEQWRPATPAITGGLPRSPEQLLAVARQFDVEHAARYQPAAGHTFCNIFAGDVMAAMGVNLPHWVDGEDHHPAAVGAPGAHELNANALLEWLADRGSSYGWLEVEEGAARLQANGGLPTVASWSNPVPGHSGHIAVVLPDQPGDPLLGPPRIAQAGARCFFGLPLPYGFGSLQPRFFAHP